MVDDHKDGRPAPSAEPEGNRDGEPDRAPPFFLHNGSMTAILASWRRSTTTTQILGPPLPLIAAVEAAAPCLLLQMVIVPGALTSEGRLIEAVAIPWFDIIDLLTKDPNIAFQIPACKREEIIAGAYHKYGFEEVTLTPRSGDHGRDVIAVKRGLGSIHVIDQVNSSPSTGLARYRRAPCIIDAQPVSGSSPRMCNLYSITRTQEAKRRLLRVKHDRRRWEAPTHH
jgi:Restriction endonuclease